MTVPSAEQEHSRHTPGPWIVEIIGQDDIYGHAYISGHVTSPLHTYAGNTVSRRDSITAPDSMTRADAYLIAAAPTMLEALTGVQEAYYSISELLDIETGLSSTEWHTALDRVDAAIAAARGEQGGAL